MLARGAHLNDQGIGLERTQVGGRYVVERMRSNGYNLGSEQSGHIVMTDYATIGDGLIAALQFLAAIVETGQKVCQLTRVFNPVPQKLQNARFAAGKVPLDHDTVQRALADGEKGLAGAGTSSDPQSWHRAADPRDGRSEDPALLDRVVADISNAIKAVS